MPPDFEPAGAESLAAILRDKRRVVALTGAGCSTGSGIPDYRDADGHWKHSKPVAAIKLGRTRADDLLSFHWREDCALALPELARKLGS